MVAIEAPPWMPRESRKVAVTIGVSLLLHAVLLAVLPPLVRDIGHGLPAVLEVRLVAAPAAIPQTSPAPVLASPARAATPKPVRPEVQAAPAAPAVTPEVAKVAVPDLAPSRAAESVPASSVAPAVSSGVAPAIASGAVTPPDLRAAYLSNPRPPYPLAARRRGLEGRVMLRAEILENGSCGRISVAHSSGHEMLDQAALQAVKQWRFVPAQRGGEAVSAWAEIPVSFSLREETTGS